MTNSTFDVQTAIKGLAVLSAIPVVGFALWADYFDRTIAELAQEDPKFDRTAEAFKVRVASLTVMILQFVLFLGSSETRRAYPVLANVLFVSAMFSQLMIQYRTEKKVRPVKDPAAHELGFALRAFVWSTVGGALYIGVLIAALRGSFWLAQITHASQGASIAFMAGGSIIGVLGGLAMGFAMGPIQMRRMFPTTKLADEPLIEQFNACFAQAGLRAPSFHVIELDKFQVGNAMMTGFRSGRGWFRPALFVSRTLITGLDSSELRSVILHEVSHLKLRHMQRRFLLSSGMILAASIGAGIVVMLANLLIPGSPANPMVGLFVVLGSFVITFRHLERQNRLQEIEADITALELGATLDALGSALRKIDKMNGIPTERRDPAATLSGSGHPSTDERIRILQAYIEKKIGHVATQETQETRETTKKDTDRAA